MLIFYDFSGSGLQPPNIGKSRGNQKSGMSGWVGVGGVLAYYDTCPCLGGPAMALYYHKIVMGSPLLNKSSWIRHKWSIFVKSYCNFVP